MYPQAATAVKSKVNRTIFGIGGLTLLPYYFRHWRPPASHTIKSFPVHCQAVPQNMVTDHQPLTWPYMANIGQITRPSYGHI